MTTAQPSNVGRTMHLVHDHPSDAERRLASAELKGTSARIRILEVLGRHDHLSAEQIHLLAERELAGLSLSTVYRTLDTLTEAGLIAHSQLSESSRSYHLAEHKGHTHLTCAHCARVLVVEPAVTEAFAARLRDSFGFALGTDHLVLTGLCETCVSNHA